MTDLDGSGSVPEVGAVKADAAKAAAWLAMCGSWSAEDRLFDAQVESVVSHTGWSVERASAAVRAGRGAADADLDRAIDVIIASLRSGGTLYACGNGGSDAHAGHLVAELVGRYAYDRPPLRAVHLSSGGPVGSCIANDYGWEQVFVRQAEALVGPDDVVALFTTSGASANLLAFSHPRIASRAHTVIAFTGPAGMAAIRQMGHAYQEVRSTATTTPAIQEEHQRLVHEVARRVEEAMHPRTP